MNFFVKTFYRRPIFFIRVLLVLAASILGYLIGEGYWHNIFLSYAGLIIGFVIGFVVVWLEKSMESISTKKIFAGGVGLLTSLFIINFAGYNLFKEFFTGSTLGYITYAFVNFVAGYFGLIIGLRISDDIIFNNVQASSNIHGAGVSGGNIFNCSPKVIDTSSLIDGRILDVVKTGFIDGVFLVPTFVLHELQRIADSQEPLKRVKGRRGLDILKELRDEKNMKTVFVDADYPNIKDVDVKLIAFAKEKNAKIITTDFNLNKVAQVQNIKVLNINDMGKALRPVILPGERMMVSIAKEGREKSQGIGYMEDGTMVVVEDAMKLIGSELDVIVTSILQTSSGRMIFARINYDKGKEEPVPDSNNIFSLQ